MNPGQSNLNNELFDDAFNHQKSGPQYDFFKAVEDESLLISKLFAAVQIVSINISNSENFTSIQVI